jgi:hypothetical protein
VLWHCLFVYKTSLAAMPGPHLGIPVLCLGPAPRV